MVKAFKSVNLCEEKYFVLGQIKMHQTKISGEMELQVKGFQNDSHKFVCIFYSIFLLLAVKNNLNFVLKISSQRVVYSVGNG